MSFTKWQKVVNLTLRNLMKVQGTDEKRFDFKTDTKSTTVRNPSCLMREMQLDWSLVVTFTFQDLNNLFTEID